MWGHFLYLRFKTFPMTPRTPQYEVFWALLSNSKHSGVPEDSKSPTLEVLGFTPTLGQSGVATGVLELGVNGKGGFFSWFEARQGRALGVSKFAPAWEFCTKEEGKGVPFQLRGGRCSTKAQCHNLGVLSPLNTRQHYQGFHHCRRTCSFTAPSPHKTWEGSRAYYNPWWHCQRFSWWSWHSQL